MQAVLERQAGGEIRRLEREGVKREEMGGQGNRNKGETTKGRVDGERRE